MKKKQRERYLQLERNLMHKRKGKKSNVLTLKSFDFYNGRMLGTTFSRLKEESWYIPFEEQIEMRIPKEYEQAYRRDVERKVHREIHKVVQEKKEVTRLCYKMGLFGAFIIFFLNHVPGLRTIYPLYGLGELVTIGAWVAVWVAVQVWLTDRKFIDEKRLTLLQILDSKTVLITDPKDYIETTNGDTMDLEDAEEQQVDMSEFSAEENGVMNSYYPYFD